MFWANFSNFYGLAMSVQLDAKFKFHYALFLKQLQFTFWYGVRCASFIRLSCWVYKRCTEKLRFSSHCKKVDIGLGLKHSLTESSMQIKTLLLQMYQPFWGLHMHVPVHNGLGGYRLVGDTTDKELWEVTTIKFTKAHSIKTVLANPYR